MDGRLRLKDSAFKRLLAREDLPSSDHVAPANWKLEPIELKASKQKTQRGCIELVRQSTLTPTHVLKHLAEMRLEFDMMQTRATKEKLYEQLLEYEDAFATNKHIDNFAHTVYKLHPVQYDKAVKSSTLYSSQPNKSLKSILSQCPHGSCHGHLNIPNMYAIHMDDATIRCNSCYNSISYKLFQMQRLREDYSSIQVTCTMNGKSMQLTIPIPRLQRNGSLDSFMAEINASFKQEAAKSSKQGVQRLKSKLDAVLAKAFNEPLGCFGLDLVHAMVRQLDFVNKICSNYDYWCQPQVIDESIRRYHQFIHLMHIQSAGTLVPTSDIDIVWHTHQTLPTEYAVFCNDIVGQLIDHDDTIPGGALESAYANTYNLWATTFEQLYSSVEPPSYIYKANFKRAHEIPMAIPVVVQDLKPTSECLAVIGTPVMDGRVRPPKSHQTQLLLKTQPKPRPSTNTSSHSTTSIAVGCATGGCQAAASTSSYTNTFVSSSAQGCSASSGGGGNTGGGGGDSGGCGGGCGGGGCGGGCGS
ncbi:Aste57867_3843 [Aphanomyces stellatus]|uniref:Aste57867_3843 protein n=1 Tax=Aphanomyces stellatus TaxID=120398 RepID=A0A485KBJ2_9STRA|nr:hypothetical protein As57867_003832 [Aphanomyces stellatus]VFT80990.1 Aste57867_3843 [Aphanomyces stellatus]